MHPTIQTIVCRNTNKRAKAQYEKLEASESASSARNMFDIIFRKYIWEDISEEELNTFYEYSDITRSHPLNSPTKSSVEHRIITTGQPVFARPRRLSPEKLTAAKAEFDSLMKLDICRPTTTRAVYREQRAQIRAEFADNQRPNCRQGRVPVRLRDQMEHVGFHHDPDCDYSLHGAFGAMDIICTHCNAAKFRGETAGMCCFSGKVKLPALEPPPEPLHSLLTGESPTSKHFLQNIQAYNSCFQMTSFGATKIIRDPFMPTFKVITLHGISSETFDIFILQIQGQIYHRAGSLIPFVDADYQFLQIYFIGNETDQLNQQCKIATGTRREIVLNLQRFLNEHNELIRLFKIALDRMPSDNHRIVIRADKMPMGQHARRFNAPTIDEVAIVIVGEQFESRDIVLHRRNEQLQRVSELHRSYDALQYPILLWRGDDGYHINMRLINPTIGKKVQFLRRNATYDSIFCVLFIYRPRNTEKTQCDELLFVQNNDSSARR
ncbi:uncharacterized protein LOC125777487 [Bactrocera dorsalis]|uniref:Uncharacterized protein LOC125777487 n=1 Tax=Bactrocera dorsalis TaxID=27457 RepID=A0ABM3JH20_BACDO|nr:uncharacterized protein LOC125777487 [Bactrocera dorsalis]